MNVSPNETLPSVPGSCTSESLPVILPISGLWGSLPQVSPHRELEDDRCVLRIFPGRSIQVPSELDVSFGCRKLYLWSASGYQAQPGRLCSVDGWYLVSIQRYVLHVKINT